MVWPSEEISTTGRSSLPSSESAWGIPSTPLRGIMTKRATKASCRNQDGRNQAVRYAMEISWWRAPPRGEGINKDVPNKRAGGGRADLQISPSPPVIQTPRGGQADQTKRGDKKHLNKINKPNWVMEHTPIKICTVRWTPPTIHVG